jgi:hypothetical protein
MSWLHNTLDWLTGAIFGTKRKLDNDSGDEEEPRAKRVKREEINRGGVDNNMKSEQTTSVEVQQEEVGRKKDGKNTGKNPNSPAQKLSVKTLRPTTANNSEETASETSQLAPKVPGNTTDPSTSTDDSSTEYPYSEFNQETFVEHGVFIFNSACVWKPVTGDVNADTTAGPITPRGCTYFARGDIPPAVRFAVVSGIHPMFPQLSGFYAIGVVLNNNNNGVVVDFLKIGYLLSLDKTTHDALVGEIPGLISTTRLATLWRVAEGSLEAIVPPDTLELDADEFMRDGPMVYHGNAGWSYCRGTTCWVMTSSMPPGRRRYVVVIGHPFSKHPSEYAIGVVVKFGSHLSLVEFRKAGVVTTLKPFTVAALVGHVEQESNFQYARMDLWQEATLVLS